MKKETIRYVQLSPDTQVKVVMTLQEEGLPTPHEKPHEREVTADEFEAVTGKLSTRDFNLAPYFS